MRYDFRCECGRAFEAVVRGTPDTTPCECGGNALRQFSITKQIQTPAWFREKRGWHLMTYAEQVAYEKEREANPPSPKPPGFREAIENNIERYRTGRMPVEEFRQLTGESGSA